MVTLLKICHFCINLWFPKTFQMDSPFQELFNGIIYFLVAQKFNELRHLKIASSNCQNILSLFANFFFSAILSSLPFGVKVERKVNKKNWCIPSAPSRTDCSCYLFLFSGYCVIFVHMLILRYFVRILSLHFDAGKRT